MVAAIVSNSLARASFVSKTFVRFHPLIHANSRRKRVMKKWYHAMCVVRLGKPMAWKDEHGDPITVNGYVVNIGLSGLNLIQAMMEVERIAIARFEGERDGNHLEETNIKTTELEMLRDQFQIEEKGTDGEPIFRSALIYFDE
jgi:hypothetical protein